MKKINMVFFGTPDFSVPSLEVLHNHPQVNLCYVISMPDRKSGRGHQMSSPEVIEFAKKNKIPFFQTENINKEEEFLEKLKNEKIDSFLVLAFAQFLSQKVLNIPTLGCFNIHTSLLPKYRGAAPIQYALLNGDTSTGVSIQKMVKKMDAGELVHGHPINISKYETGGLLYTRLKFQAALALNDFLEKILSNNIIYDIQDEDKVSFAPTLTREDGYLNFKEMKFDEVFNKSRALFPWPGTYCFLNKKRLKVIQLEKSNKDLKPGAVHFDQDGLYIGCIDSSIRISKLQLEGKKMCSDTELFNGFKGDININPS